MRVLLVKTSSLGDIIHTLPALTDAQLALPDIQFDWVVEEAFTDLPKLHPAVDQVLPIAFRRLRKNIFNKANRQEWRAFCQHIKQRHYDLILDAQGLIKSAWITYQTNGKRVGLSFNSAREWLAALVYHRRYEVNFYQHAIVRMRSLFSLALGYPIPHTDPHLGFQLKKTNLTHEPPYLVFLHGTTWKSKEWPESYWLELAKLANQANFKIKMSAIKQKELERVYRLASYADIEISPSLSMLEMANLLANAAGVVAVDTGLGHLAAAMNIPTVSLYGPTSASYTGATGQQVTNLSSNFSCSPCFNARCTFRRSSIIKPACYTMIPPMKVWLALKHFIDK